MRDVSLLHPREHVVSVEELPPSDEVAELRAERRKLRLVVDEQRRELIRQEREMHRLRRELAHAYRQAARSWWRR